MAVTITGGKYAIRSLTAAGTTTVTIGTETFVSGDFGATQRMVALFTSANVFKGIAWVRRFTSTTVLELENQFVDPVTGVYATQAVGDQVLVSKNAAESATTGFTVTTPDNNVVTVSDNVLMGTAGSETSVCFFDQHKQFTMTNGFRFNGGVAVFGKLMSYDGVSKESFIWSRECTARPNENYPVAGSPQYNLWGTGGTSAHMFFFGGAMGSPMRRSFFIGAEGTGATNKTYAFYGTRIYHACASPGNGGNWASNADRHLLFKTIHEADYNNANLIVWGNGSFQGSFLSFPQFGAGSPLGIFRASSAASFGASANNRTIVADTGSGSFIDDINNGSYTFTNVITPAVTIARFAGGNVPITFQFSDDYTNLQPRTTLVVRRGDGTTVSSVVNTASSTFTATVVQATYSATGNGAATPTNFYTTFNYGIKCYGFQVISGAHTPYTYSLGTAGSGTDLKLGGLINQVADAGVTLNETDALALSSKFTVDAPNKRVTVTANATLSELVDYTTAWNCASAANAVHPNLSNYPTKVSGTAVSLFTDWFMTINSGVSLNPDDKYKELILQGTGKLTVNGTINLPYRDVDGLRVTVTNLDPDSFGTTWYLRHKLTSSSTWTNVSGTGNTTLILLAGGVYDIQIRSPGYEWESELTLDTNASLSLDAALRYHVSANNTPQYTMVYDAVLEAIFNFDAAVGEVAVENETGTIIQPGFAELYRATQRIMHLPSLVWTWENPIAANSTSQKILIPEGNPVRMYLTNDSNATVKITCPVIHANTGESADDRVKGNSAGYSIILGSPATAESAGLAAQIISGLGGANYDGAEASQVVLRELITEVQDLLDDIKGTGFAKDTHSLTDIKAAADTSIAVSA